MNPRPLFQPFARALLRSQPDERLATLTREGHEAAFDEIVRRYRVPLVAFASAYAPGNAEDVVQESLARTWQSLTSSEQEIALKPWLYTVVRNRALNARRDSRSHEQLDETIDGVRQPSEIVLQREQLDRVVVAVAALPETQRRALVASALEGRTHHQIAREFETSPGSVRGLIHRGRVAVRSAAGSVVPLPLVAALSEAAGGLTAGGVATAGTVAGGSLAAKGAAVAVIGVLATGSGFAVERSLDGERGEVRASIAGGGAGQPDSGEPGGPAGVGPRDPDDSRRTSRGDAGLGDGRTAREAGDDLGNRSSGGGDASERATEGRGDDSPGGNGRSGGGSDGSGRDGRDDDDDTADGDSGSSDGSGSSPGPGSGGSSGSDDRDEDGDEGGEDDDDEDDDDFDEDDESEEDDD